MEFTGERFIPNISGNEMEIEHTQRYHFAAPAVQGKIVLDAACGEGYGSAILAEQAARVYGIDISEEAIQNAKQKYSNKKIEFHCASIASLPFDNDSIDCVVSFETIEHVDEELQHQFMKEIKRVLRPHGFLIMSTPNKKIYSDFSEQENEFHVKEFYKQEFFDFLSVYFKEHTIYSQYFEVTANIEDRNNVEAVKESVFDEDNAKYYIAICSDVPVDLELKDSILIPNENLYLGTRKRIQVLQDEVEARNTHLQELDSFVKSQSEELAQEQKRVKELGDWGHKQEKEIHKQENEIRKQEEEIHKQGQEIDMLKACLEQEKVKYEHLVQNRNEQQELVKQYRTELEGILNSRSFRTMQKVLGLKNKIFGRKTTVRDAAPKREEKQLRNSFHPLTLPKAAAPLVSIIIPAYNQFAYTYDCIESIIKNTKDIAYEVILADDVSTDKTKDAWKFFRNIVHIKNVKNLGFLRNCNNAAVQAKGKYLLLLNNDTEVKEGWLDALLAVFEENDEVGLVGSKLLNADGTLQEAGGIIWADASGWNFGLGNDPALPEYNYLKETDYVSGASMLIEKSLWQKIGGFDERYAPAYFEDSDLAFEVRRLGKKVIYQPLSEIVHFEGVSNGRDESVGIKSYQVKNREKFVEKWAGELKKDQFENGSGVFWARDRSRGKRTVLVIDHYVPHYDKDAGSRTVFLYIKMLLDLGMNVKFIGDNFYKHEPYTTVLEQMGVEVLYGVKYSDGKWKEWVDENARYLDVVFLNRPHIARNYIDYIKQKTDAKIVYFGHDLHFLRENREYELTGDEVHLALSKEMEAEEYQLMKKADQAIMVSEEEKKIIKDTFGVDIEVIPIFYFDGDYQETAEANEGTDLLFVGGFAHTPNIDGLKWFVQEVFPSVKKELKDVKLHVVGSNPTQEVLDMANEDIIVHGFVSDEELDRFYNKCRVCVIPLRYGAGVKGKTIEAMYHQVPIVSTGIGIEGLPEIAGVIQAADQAEEFARQVIAKYNDAGLRQEDRENFRTYIQEHFSYDAAKKVAKKIF